MPLEKFKQLVLTKLRGYAPGYSDQYLIAAINEYTDIVLDGYHHYQGIDYVCDYAAWNISMCI